MRIVSFLPSATEMVFALGLGDQLVGVTHECDFPAEALTKPIVVRSATETHGLSPQQIDERVSRSLQMGRSLYTVDEALLKKLAPDLILTQDLCQVCAPSGNEVGRVLRLLRKPPQVLYLTPTGLADIFDNIREVGEATGKKKEALGLVRRLEERVRAIADRTAHLPSRPRVFCMEWLAPPYNAGHWVPELVERAGGIEGLGQKGKDSIRMVWEQVLEYAPEVLILTPCGFDLHGVLRQAFLLTRYPEWDQLPAVKNGRVFAVDANSYFARPGPRIVEGLELLAALVHPEEFAWSGVPEAYRHISYNDLCQR
jgi:iron complex transport system substrate-binding protein